MNAKGVFCRPAEEFCLAPLLIASKGNVYETRRYPLRILPRVAESPPTISICSMRGDVDRTQRSAMAPYDALVIPADHRTRAAHRRSRRRQGSPRKPAGFAQLHADHHVSPLPHLTGRRIAKIEVPSADARSRDGSRSPRFLNSPPHGGGVPSVYLLRVHIQDHVFRCR